MNVLIIDNFDSFTYNLVNLASVLGANVSVLRNDASLDFALATNPDAIILSPGPGHPKDSNLTLELAKSSTSIPILGVCLGHQAIGQAFGGNVVRAINPVHGKSSKIYHDGKGLFEGIESPFNAVRYHSLVVEEKTLPNCLKVTGKTFEGEIMALQHKTRPLYGVQFHPESILSQNGEKILTNFLEAVK